MYQIFDFRKLLGLVALIAGAIAVPIWLIRSPHGILDFFEAMSLTSLIFVGILVLIGETRAFRAIWATKVVRERVFPYIHGVYEGSISSNWSVISAVKRAATEGQKLDASALHVEAIGALSKDVRVEIRASLLRLSMKLVPKDAYTDSQTVWLRPVREDEGGYPRLYYMYKSRTQGAPVATDVAVHFGAAFLDVIEENGITCLRGVYWTERDWPHANNTAGTLSARKVG